MPISVVVADDHQMVVAGLRALFATHRDVQLVGETYDGAEVIGLVEETHPDVLVLDLTMPGTGGLEVMRQLAERGSRVRVVVLSMHTTPSYALRAIKLGALGYVAKQAPSSELLAAIRAAAAGKQYLAEPLSERALKQYENRLESGKLDLFDTLSKREREVMKYTALGMTSRQIAEKLLIGRRTVESYLANVTAKLGLESRSDLIRYAVRTGLVTPDES
jgi:two-component system, NarL family, response regulator NreC